MIYQLLQAKIKLIMYFSIFKNEITNLETAEREII